MKLSELREIMDMLNPNCEVVVLKPNTPSNKIPMGFHIEPDKMNVIGDTVFLMNMISDMSRIDFRLYKSSQAAGRMIFSVQDDYTTYLEKNIV